MDRNDSNRVRRGKVAVAMAVLAAVLTLGAAAPASTGPRGGWGDGTQQNSNF